ncbi:MAG: response regulator [Comamonadaceae bacterium]|nr:MAG: response regulator [Comamonadaceae bacterium]
MSEIMPQQELRRLSSGVCEVGRGREVWVYTPWMTFRPAPARAPVRTDAHDAVLVLEAHALAESVTAAVLSGLPGAHVAKAVDRQSFLQALHDARWSLVVVSFDLEGYAGQHALRDAQQRTSAPLIAIGTAPETAAVVAALGTGAADFIERARLQDVGPAAVRILAREGASPRGSDEQDARMAQAAAWLAERNATVLFDEHWMVSNCSRGVAAVLGYEAADLIGQPVEAFFRGMPEASALLLRLRNSTGGEPFHDCGWMLRRDGLRMWAEITCVADVGADGRPHRFCLTVRDATLQYRASQSVRLQADAAAAATSARNLFLGSIAHELRSALAPISTSAILLEGQALEPPRQERLVGIIRRNAASAARLLDDLLTFSTASENKLALRIGEVNLNRLVTECIYAAQHQAIAAGVDLRVEFSTTQVESQLRCDAARVQQVLVNLLGNAIKFTPLRGTVWVRTACDDESFYIEVADTGAGIDPAVLPFIFEPFEQGGSEVTNRYGGFGLGLAICAAIARQHGGRIVASSAGVGQGASFRLCLPRGGARADFPARARTETAPLHVLYVEDHADAADAMRYALTTLGWTMTHAATCASARALVHESGESFDVILADLGLPDGSGLELGNELCRHLPVVALTAYGAPLAMEGFASQLMKPAEITDVQRALLRAVAIHRAAAAEGAGACS